MYSDNINDPLFDVFIFETTEQTEQLEQYIIKCEAEHHFDCETIESIFRIMHTIKGSAALMSYESISTLAHSIEDLFHFIREQKPSNINCNEISNIILSAVDFVKKELVKLQNGEPNNCEHVPIISIARKYLQKIKQENPDTTMPTEHYEEKPTQAENVPIVNSEFNFTHFIHILFKEDCPMVNMKAFEVLHKLKKVTTLIEHIPLELLNNQNSIDILKEQGLKIIIGSENLFDVDAFVNRISFIESYEHNLMEKHSIAKIEPQPNNNESNAPDNAKNNKESTNKSTPTTVKQALINVHIEKLDKLLDLMGELVISESLVSRNRDDDEKFEKALTQQRKITNELQEIVMSIRMLPITKTFNNMNRIVRDMCQKLDKHIELEIIGNDVELDKNIIDHISDPLVHLVRNAVDHGIESATERELKNKPIVGKLTLEAKNSGSDVWVFIKDDGKGLDKAKILQKAKTNGLLKKSEEEYTDKEIFSMIFLPGFSTKENVSEFSGRGVGLDIVTKNIESLGGSITVNSTIDVGTEIAIKIPLTLSIIEGMIVKVGNSTFSIPDTSVQETFRAREQDVFIDLNEHEMIMIRGQCYPIIRLSKRYKLNTPNKNIEDGILVMVKNEQKGICLFADTLLGVQQVVVKALPAYVKRTSEVDGCALMGDGSISLILNIASMIDNSIT